MAFNFLQRGCLVKDVHKDSDPTPVPRTPGQAVYYRITEVREMTKKKMPAQVGAPDVLWSAHGSDGYF
jgi:hypothetical protein